MALVRVFNRILIDGVKTSPVRRWPASIEAITFQLDDLQFVNPAESFSLYLRLSWSPTEPTGNEPLDSPIWPYIDGPNTWVGGAKGRDGSAPMVILGPFKKVVDGVEVFSNPTWAQFRAVPVAGTPRVGLFADLEDVA